MIAPGNLQVVQKVTTIQSLQCSTSVSALWSFLGLCNVFRTFVLNFARISSLLNKNLNNRDPQFGLDCEYCKSVDTLEKNLTTTLAQALPRLNEMYMIDTAACDTQVAVVLLHGEKDEAWKPVCFCSFSLCDAETINDTTHKESLSIVWVVLLRRPHLEGSYFIIRTDNQALQWILDLKESTGILAQSILQLMKEDVEIVDYPGLNHQAATSLSRLHNVDRQSIKEAESGNINITMCCILGQESDELCATEESGVKSLLIQTSNEFLEVQQSNTHSWNMVKLAGTDTPLR